MKIVKALAVCAVVGLAAGCSSGSGSGPGSDPAVKSTGSAQTGAKTGAKDSGACKGTIGVTFCYRIKISGAATADGTATGGGPHGTCADWVKGESGSSGLELVIPTTGLLLSTPRVMMNDVILTGYTGPGTYSTDQVTAEAGFGMVIDDKQFDMDSTDGTTASVTVNADASGTATFKKLEIRSEPAPRPAVDATFSWTCAD